MIQIIKYQSLKSHNSFGIEASAEFFCEVSTEAELFQALEFATKSSLPILILGGGSNLLLTKNYEGLVVKIGNKGIEIVEETQSTVVIKVAAGENWHDLVCYCLQNNWFGMENLSLIPGNVGASPMQNIGAYGIEAKNLIQSVRFLAIENMKWENLEAEKCNFGYRESIFKHELKGKVIIWSVNFCLQKKANVKVDYGDIQAVLSRKGIEKPSPGDVSEAVIEIRRSKLPDPLKIGNAGSFFKNPVVENSVYEDIKSKYPSVPSYLVDANHVKVPAGWLIENAGWKGKKLGSYGVHEKQALVLVNYGGASGLEIWNLSKEIQNDIKAKFNIDLQIEVNLV